MLKIHEFTLPSGELESIWLYAEGPDLALATDEGLLPLPRGALEGVMRRYGAQFDAEATSVEHATLELGDGARLRHVRHLAGYDVIARDYLVYERSGSVPLCAMATSVAGALRHLALAARAPRVS
jgi:hypothetical protein